MKPMSCWFRRFKLGYVMFLDQRVLSVEGDGVEVEIEGSPPFHAQPTDRTEPRPHQFCMATGVDAATVFGEERPLRDHVQPCKQGQPLVQHVTHHVAVPRVAVELQCQQRAHRAAGGHHLRTGQSGAAKQGIERAGDQPGHEQEKPPNRVPKAGRTRGADSGGIDARGRGSCRGVSPHRFAAPAEGRPSTK